MQVLRDNPGAPCFVHGSGGELAEGRFRSFCGAPRKGSCDGPSFAKGFLVCGGGGLSRLLCPGEGVLCGRGPMLGAKPSLGGRVVAGALRPSTGRAAGCRAGSAPAEEGLSSGPCRDQDSGSSPQP